MKKVLENSFWQLLTIYSFIMILIALGFLSKYTLYFNLLAIIIALFSLSMNFEKKETINKNLHFIIVLLSIILILLFRIIPYLNNNIPIGYDGGIYRYGIEHGLENLDGWILTGGMEPGFLYLMKPLNILFGVDFLLTYGFIFFSLLLGFAVYVFSKEYFDKNTAAFSILIYSLSLVQLKVFSYLYYKNVIALSLILFSFYFLKRKQYNFFIISGVLVGIIHRPSFYIFGLSFLFFTIYNYKSNLKKNIFMGISILFLTSLFYLGKFSSAILVMISPVISSITQPGLSPGTFISFSQYQFSILFLLPLALVGFIHLAKSKQFNIFFFYTITLFIIIYFQLFFFNRFIIFFDIALIIFAAVGSNRLISKKSGIIIFSLLLISALILSFSFSLSLEPQINQETFDSIKSINISKNAYIVSISKEFSPYLLGWTNNKIIAPGLFDYDIWANEERWEQFWSDLNASELKDHYKEDIYLFTNKDLNSSCYTEKAKNLYLWSC